MFSPLAFRNGAILYDLITHAPSSSHLALSPFDLYREPLAIVAIADGQSLDVDFFNRRTSSSGATVLERNIRGLYQELEDLRDVYPKALVYQTLIFDYAQPSTEVSIPEGIVTIPSEENSKRTTMKTVMCTISSLLLAEMTTLAKSFEAMSSIDSPGQYGATKSYGSTEDGFAQGNPRRNSQFAIPQHLGRSNSVSSAPEKAKARMSMPPVPTRSTSNGASMPSERPETPTGAMSHSPAPVSDMASSSNSTRPSSPDSKIPRSESANAMRDASRDRISVQGFGPGGANDKWRIRGKGRVSIVIGSMYLQAGRWNDALKELGEGATAARSLNDHIWHGKALELMLMSMFLLAWTRTDFAVPQVCMPTQERPGSSSDSKAEAESGDPRQPKAWRSLQAIVPELLERIIGMYSRISSENLPPLAFSETAIRFCKILSALHLCDGSLNEKFLEIIVRGNTLSSTLTTSPRPHIAPTRQQIVTLLFRAFPSSSPEVISTADRVSILSGIISVLGPLGFQRKKALVLRELVSVLIGGLVEARTKGAAEAGVHPAASLLSLAPSAEQTGAPLYLSQNDVEHGIEAFLGLLCKAYGIVGFSPGEAKASDGPKPIEDSDVAVINRIKEQSAVRCFGFPSIKIDVLRSCINFAEALPDFKGVLMFSSDLMRTAGSGVAPRSRRDDAAPLITRDEQIRLATGIARTAGLTNRLGLDGIEGEFWDEFLLRGIELEALPATRTPVPHAKSILPGATANRASQDVNPFIYNPFLKEAAEASTGNLVAGEMANFKVKLQNTYEVELEIESIRIEASGIDFEAVAASTVVGPYRTQVLKLKGCPREAGTVNITGAYIKVRGCRERRFPIFTQPWVAARPDKVKLKGILSIGQEESGNPMGRQLETDSLSLNVIPEQPLVVVKSTSLRQSTVMILEGERQVFSVTLKNMSTTPVDFMLFSFKDSTQQAIQTALSHHETTPAELYEYEIIVMKKQALRLPRSDQNRKINPGEEAIFEFEIFGKAGLTNATIQVDYTYLGVPQEDITEKFYTRQVSLDLAVTVNASVDVTRIDTLPLHGDLPPALWERMGGKGAAKPDEYCLLSMDLRNSWPSQVVVHLEGGDGMTVDENILPGKTCRVIMPLKRIYLEDPHAAIPSLNPSRNRQFVVSTSKISPTMERANREAFWYRERILEVLKATWKTTSAPRKTGVLELRSIRLSPRMVDVVKVNDVDIDISMLDQAGADAVDAVVDEFMQVKVRVFNRTNRPIVPVVRLMPALCHRPLSVALDYTRKFAWNGTLQQLLPQVDAGEAGEFAVGVTALCRGEFELTASVEEVFMVDEEALSEKQKKARHRSGSQLGQGAVMIKERRTWYSRQPFVLRVRDEHEIRV